MEAILLSPDLGAELWLGKFIALWSFNKKLPIFPGRTCITGDRCLEPVYSKPSFQPPKRKCHSMLEHNANFQLHIIIWNVERALWGILLFRRKKTQCYFCIYTLSPGSIRICLCFLGHTPPSQQVDSQALTCCLRLALPLLWLKTELTRMLPSCGSVEWALDFESVGWIPVPAVAWVLCVYSASYFFKHLCTFTSLTSHGSVRYKEGERICPFYREGKWIPRGSTWLLLLGVRRAPTHWLLPLTLSCAALRGGLSLDGGKGRYFIGISGLSLFLCSHGVSLPPSSLPGDLPS